MALVRQRLDPISSALSGPSGARFYKCALQVNPFGYVEQFQGGSAFADEAAYNKAIVESCVRNEVEVIAITDHYRVKRSVRLAEVAQDAGIHVFPGFEAVTKEGVHFLCICDPDTGAEEVERFIGDCGIYDDGSASPTGDYDVLELLAKSEKWGSVFVAAHVAASGGLLRTLSGQARINAWTSQDLLACAIAGEVDGAPDDLRAILNNRNPEYRRAHAIAILNAADVSDPEKLASSGATCWIKMSEVSVDGLRQAFLDPDSRIRLNSDPTPEEHVEIAALAWESGFLDGQGIHFSENLNVLIGGRGTGKSTVIESIRYALGLEPLTPEARQAHEGIVRHVLRSGTKVSLLVRSYRPKKKEYRIERTVPNPPVVRDESGDVLDLAPEDVVHAEVFGQHEIAELVENKTQLTNLLNRFVEPDQKLDKQKRRLSRDLKKTRRKIVELQEESERLEERLASLPRLEETIKQYEDAGLEERLKDQSLLVREERILATVTERIQEVESLIGSFDEALPLDTAFLSDRAIQGLPGGNHLLQARSVLEELGRSLRQSSAQLSELVERANNDLAEVRSAWGTRKSAVQSEYEKILRELQRTSVDGEEFIGLRRRIEDLRPLKQRRREIAAELKKIMQQRMNLLAEWEDAKQAQFSDLERASKRVTKQLRSRVRVRVEYAANREPLLTLLRESIGGRLKETIDALASQELSLAEFAATMRSGRSALEKKYGITRTQADNLASAPPDVLMSIEELELPPDTQIELNVATDAGEEVWKTLKTLSKGQKATAILLLLLLESNWPLVIDQPEDDLDNRFVYEGVVPKMRSEKRQRQFVFATHNANIPVLGDAEQIVGLQASGEGLGHAVIPDEHVGSIDRVEVRELVEDILEGGKEAFEKRRRKYGF